VDRICRQHRLAAKQMSSDFVDALQIYHWPGNVRDLINALHYAVQAAFAEQRLYPQHLPVEIRGHVMRARRDPSPAREAEEEVHAPAPQAGGNGSGPSPVTGSSGMQGTSSAPGALGVPVASVAYGPSGPAGGGGTPAVQSSTCPPPAPREGFGFANEVFPSFRSASEVTMDRMESAYLVELIRRSRGEIASAIALSGLSRARLYELLQKHSISLRSGN